MKIVVTGALGHIGSRLIRDLPFSFPGCEILMIDNLMTQRYCSLFNLPKEGNYRFIEGDVTKIDLSPLLQGAYALIHLAAITDAAGSFDKAEEVENNNYQGTQKVADACSKTGTRLIALSSTSVYGTQKKLVSEDCTLDELKPQSPYAACKLKEEQLVTRLSKEKGLQSIICRFGTIYGTSPGMRFHTAVNKFCWQAAMGQPITVWSTAYDQKRPYLDIVDARRALEFIIKNDLFDGKIYNVLTINATVRNIVEKIKLNVPSLKIKHVESSIMNQLSYEVLNQKFKDKGFQALGNLQAGISDTLTLFKEQHKHQRT
jgi:nucleoside-diphosphate-sugar epimerase